MLTNLTTVLRKAYQHHYAIGAFNTNNLETTQAIINAANKLRAPIIIQTSEGAIKYAGLDYLLVINKTAANKTRTPVVLHLDHGTNLEVIKTCIKKGYTSVMIDGSHYSFEKNIRLTKQVVAHAHKHNVSVEGELGTIGGAEDLITSRHIKYTDPAAAREFVDRTGIDALAIAIGTSHGAYKFAGTAHLDIKRLAEINKQVKIPLVLHGASHVPPQLIKTAQHYGAKLGKTEGVPNNQIKTAIKNGIAKINTDTDLRLAFIASVRKTLHQSPKNIDPRKILGPAREAMQKTVEQRITLFGSRGKA